MKKIILSLLVVSALAGDMVKASEAPDEPTSPAGAGVQYTPNEKYVFSLCRAVVRNDVEEAKSAVKQAITDGFKINEKNNSNETPLFITIISGHVALAIALIDAGAEVNAVGKQGETPLHLAAVCNLLEVVEALVAARAEVNARDKIDKTPLHYAAENAYSQYSQTVQVLLAAGANVHAKDNNNNTALHWAALSGNAQATQALLDAGAEVDAKNDKGETPLYVNLHALYAYSAKTAITLIAAGADINTKDSKGSNFHPNIETYKLKQYAKRLVHSLGLKADDIKAQSFMGEISHAKEDSTIIELIKNLIITANDESSVSHSASGGGGGSAGTTVE